MSWGYTNKTTSAYATTNPLTVNYTCGATDKLLVVNIWLIGAQINRGGGIPTYNNIELTDGGGGAVSQAGAETTIETWYLINPPTGQSYTVSVANASGANMELSVSSYAPSLGGCVKDTSGSTMGNSANPSLNLSNVTAHSLMVGNVGSGYRNVPTVGTNYTILNTYDAGNTTWGDEYWLDCGAGGTVAVSFTQVTETWGLIGLAFRETAPSYALTTGCPVEVHTSASVALAQHYGYLTTGCPVELHTSASVALVQHYGYLTTACPVELQTADNTVITYHAPGFSLTISDSQQTLASEEITLSQHYGNLVLEDGQHLLQSDNISLSQGLVITVNDSQQLHSCENIDLSYYPYFLLVTQDGQQDHIADNIALGGGATIVVLASMHYRKLRSK